MGRGLILYAGSLHFRVTTITDRRLPRGRAISVLSLADMCRKAHVANSKHDNKEILVLVLYNIIMIDELSAIFDLEHS